MTTPKLVIRHHSGIRSVLLRVLFVLVIAALIFGAYRFGFLQGVGKANTAVSELDRLRNESEHWESRLETLRGESARLQSAQKIDREAYDEVRSNLNRLQQDNLQLREELQFYRSIVAPSQRQEGVQIQHFSVEAAEAKRQFRYKLTLINLQGIKGRKEVARGDVRLYVAGKQKGQRRRLDLKELGAGDDTALEFSIRYFKHFEGEIRLPDGFVPDNAVVVVNPRDDDQGVLQKQVPWPSGPSN